MVSKILLLLFFIIRPEASLIDQGKGSLKDISDIYHELHYCSLAIPPPPEHHKTAKMARFVVHFSDWASLATISTRNPIQGLPFANVFSMSDGVYKNSSGIPYFYLTPLEMSVKDLAKNGNGSITVSLAETDYCARMEYDAEDPRCAHTILNGNIVEVKEQKEKSFARRALFSRHPEMADWPAGHKWFFAKMVVKNIILLDFFGGAIDVDVEEYFKVKL